MTQTITYLTSTLSPTMLPAETSLETTTLSHAEALELINDPNTDLRVGGATQGMWNFLGQHFPGLDVSNTHQDIRAKVGQDILVASYTGPKIPFNGVPEGPFDVRYTHVEIHAPTP